jgi:hypothetical protein
VTGRNHRDEHCQIGTAIDRLAAVTNLKPFDPDDVDETLTRVVMHRGISHVLFPFIDALGNAPKFNSIDCAIAGPAATIQDFASLAGLIKAGRSQGEWYISFNTPWLITAADAEAITQRVSTARSKRG